MFVTVCTWIWVWFRLLIWLTSQFFHHPHILFCLRQKPLSGFYIPPPPIPPPDTFHSALMVCVILGGDTHRSSTCLWHLFLLLVWTCIWLLAVSFNWPKTGTSDGKNWRGYLKNTKPTWSKLEPHFCNFFAQRIKVLEKIILHYFPL